LLYLNKKQTNTNQKNQCFFSYELYTSQYFPNILCEHSFISEIYQCNLFKLKASEQLQKGKELPGFSKGHPFTEK